MNDDWLERFCKDEDMQTGCLSMLGSAVVVWVIFLLCVLMSSCKTREYFTVPETHTDTIYIGKHQRDSIWLHDSIFVSEKQKGDTIFLTSIKWQTKYVERQVHDTIFQSRVDSVGVPYPVEVKVEKALSKWQKLRIRLGEVLLLLAGLGFAFCVFKLKRTIMP